MASVWGELKRRNVVRVAIAYAIVAWLLIEVSATTFPILNLPTWTTTLVTVLLLLGFPVALIFAWAYELTPEGIKKEKDVDRSDSITHITRRKLDFVIIGVLVVAVGLLLADKVYFGERDTPADDVDAAGGQSIAVLPFVNRSPDPDQEYFSDGLSEEILNLLATIPELKVIGRTSSFAFKGKNEDLRVIGEALGVDLLLEGSVATSGDRVRITVRLNDVSDASQIWSATYEPTMTDIFAVQDEVAAAIIDAMQIHVATNPVRGRPTESAEAYALFLRARASLSASGEGAEELLLRAIELDAEFAEAYEQLAYTYWNLAGGGRLKMQTGQELMGEAAANALAIDPDLVFAQALYQSGNTESWSLLGEIEAFERAVREQPNNPDALGGLSWLLLKAGYLEEAVNLAERRVDIEPLWLNAHMQLGYALYAAGRPSDDAIAAMQIADQLGHQDAIAQIGDVYLIEEQDDKAIVHIGTFLRRNDLADIFRLREMVTAARDPETGQAYLDRRIPEIAAAVGEDVAADFQMGMGELYLLFGFLDRYFEVILDFDPVDSIWTDADTPIFNGMVSRRVGFTAHPKYLVVARAAGIVDVWEKRGPPDFCSKSIGDWVCE